MTGISKPFGVLLAALLALALPGSTALAKGKTQLELQVKPANAQLLIDNKPQGKVGTNRVIDVTPGYHIIHLTLKGDEHEERVKIAPNQKTTYTFEFDVAPPTTDTVQDPVSPDSEGPKTPSPAPAPAPQNP